MERFIIADRFFHLLNASLATRPAEAPLKGNKPSLMLVIEFDGYRAVFGKKKKL